MELPMAPKQAQYDELRAMGSITSVGVILKIFNINYNCSQLDYGETCTFLVCSRTKLRDTILSWHNYYLVNYIQVIRLWVTYSDTFLSLHILKSFAKYHKNTWKRKIMYTGYVHVLGVRNTVFSTPYCIASIVLCFYNEWELWQRFIYTNIICELAQVLQQSDSTANVYFSRYKHTEDHKVRFSMSYKYGLCECFM